MAKTIIVKNNTIKDQWISDFGVKVPVSGQISLAETEDVDEIYGSQDLKDKIASAIFIINDGTSDLSAVDGVEYVRISSSFDLSNVSGGGDFDVDDIFTFVSGDSVVSWDGNIVTNGDN